MCCQCRAEHNRHWSLASTHFEPGQRFWSRHTAPVASLLGPFGHTVTVLILRGLLDRHLVHPRLFPQASRASLLERILDRLRPSHRNTSAAKRPVPTWTSGPPRSCPPPARHPRSSIVLLRAPSSGQYSSGLRISPVSRQGRGVAGVAGRRKVATPPGSRGAEK
jgi:hypothetical protein